MNSISLISPINRLSYGYVGSYINKSLQELGQTVSLWPIGGLDPEQQFYTSVQRGINNAKFYDVLAPCVRIFHQHSLDQFVGKGEHIGWPIFELNTFNSVERHHLNKVDKLFVCSKWAQSVVQYETKRISKVVPLGVDTTIFTPKKNNRRTTVFFTCGKWEKRKGHDIIPSAFRKAFDDKENVELWMMCDSDFYSEEEKKTWRNYYVQHTSKVKFIPPVKQQSDTAYIMQQTDCGLFPSRAEGWGLPILEMMSCGKHVITTNYSGQTEFCTSENSMLVDVKDTELARDNKWFLDGHGEWALIGENELDQIIEYMREVHRKKQNGELDINQAGLITANQYTWLNSAKKLLEVL